MTYLLISRAFIFITFLQLVQLATLNGTNYFHSLYLDNDKKFHISWKFNETDIEFEVVVNTTGYVGLGFSPDGTITKADMVIGNINNGQPSLDDYHELGNGSLKKDAVNDWVLLSSSVANNQTELTFQRKLITKDANDMDITSNTMRLIWTYGDGNFTKDNFTLGRYRSLYLLQIQRPNEEIPADAEKLIITMNETLVPNADTTYWCNNLPLPEIQENKQIIKISPIVTEGNELLVHHMLLYICGMKNPNKTIGIGRKCYNNNMPQQWEKCSSVIYAWAIGGSNFPLPEHVGYPLDVGEPISFMLEIHYDNPQRKSGVRDSSGFEIILIPARRQFDAAVIELGNGPLNRLDTLQKIPPYQSHFRTSSVCLSTCLYEIFPPKNETTVMKIFAVMLHAHFLGTSIILRHYRNGKEIQTIAADRYYDFNYQETIFLKKEVEILRGDDLKLECVYNSMERTNFTFGGLSTRNEMCIAFLVYYPKMSIGYCWNDIRVDDIEWLEDRLNPANLQKFKDPEFTKEFEQTINGVGRNSSLFSYCSNGTNFNISTQPTSNLLNILRYEIEETTQGPNPTTEGPSGASVDHRSLRSFSIIIIVIMVNIFV